MKNDFFTNLIFFKNWKNNFFTNFGIRNWKNWKSLEEALNLKEALDLTVQTWKLQVGVYNEDVKLKVIMLLTTDNDDCNDDDNGTF